MATEVFRFVTIRSPQSADTTEPGDSTIRFDQLYSPFVESLRELRKAGLRDRITAAAKAFIASENFIGSRNGLDERLFDYHARLTDLPEDGFAEAAKDAFNSVFGVSTREYAGGESFQRTLARVADSVVVAAIEVSVAAQVRSLLTLLAATIGSIQKLSKDVPLTRAAIAHPVMVLPEGIFPLPPLNGDLREHRRIQRESAAKTREARRQRLAQLSADMTAHRRAIDELLTAFKSSATRTTHEVRARIGAASIEISGRGFILNDTDVARLSGATRAVLNRADISSTGIDVANSIALLERKVSETVTSLYANARVRSMVRIGNNILPTDIFPDGGVMSDGGGQSGPVGTPGPCPPAAIDESASEDDSVTMPKGHGEARILGIADLMIVEQKLSRYELGEIAHIENVLKSEVRDRRFKTSTTTEQTTLIETEVTDEKQKDLASTERFELQNEAQNVISENTSVEAGLTITASYGPSVEATSNFNYAKSNSKEESKHSSSNFARDTTSRAVSRLQKRTLERRFFRTLQVVEETNRHSFDNKDGSDNISGVYRFVDKIYEAQIVNYGKRLMLEFIVPEPAAFWRYALTKQPLETVSPAKPEPPGYCLPDGKTFLPLQAQDVTRDNYSYWASKYGASDVEPPPPLTMLVTGGKKGPESFQTAGTGQNISSDVFDVDIPDGYAPHSAYINAYGETQLDPPGGTHHLVFQIQEQQRLYTEPPDDKQIFYLHLNPTAKVPVSVNSLGFYNYEVLVTVFCTLSLERLQQWQLNTYASIMNAYNALQNRYDNAVEAARIRSGYGQPMGRNPAANRECERIELKRGCISLLTGQRFEAFDAMNRNVAPYGYPEIDFAEAKAEGRYIQFFEQAFEWPNMTYLFYPYFWGRKDEWPMLAQLNDDDPLFNRFLQAGAARVQVPVRLGFETPVRHYVTGIEIWDAEGNLITAQDGEPDSLQFSLVDELKSQLGNNNIEGPGRLSVTADNDLVEGSGTEFSDFDENRRIIIGGVTYVIKSVDEQRITLRTKYSGTTESDIPYSLGGVLVGEPWEVRLPTSLVKLDNYTF